MKHWTKANIKEPSDTIFQGVLNRWNGKDKTVMGKDGKPPYLDVIIFENGTFHFQSNMEYPNVELGHYELKEIYELVDEPLLVLK